MPLQACISYHEHIIWIIIWWYWYHPDLFRARRLACSSSVLSIWITFFSLATSWLSEFFSTCGQSNPAGNTLHSTLATLSGPCWRCSLLSLHRPTYVVSAPHQASKNLKLCFCFWSSPLHDLHDPCHSLFPLLIKFTLLISPQIY